MNLTDYIHKTTENPFESIVPNGGYCGIFKKIACIGDSLAAGKLETAQNGFRGLHDFYEYSWPQYIANDTGCEVYNFSRGGMSAREFFDSYAPMKGYWSRDYMAQAYIIALGVNDISQIMRGEYELGSIEDIDVSYCYYNKNTFTGYYARIIQKYKWVQPKAKFFLMTMPRTGEDTEREKLADAHREIVYRIAELLENCYVLDFRKYAPEYNADFKKKFCIGGHMSPAGYRLTALMVESYIDHVIRNNMDDFKNVGFIGTPYYNENEKW